MELIEKIKSNEAVIVVIGLGYVGLPLAVEKAKAGFKVIGIDRNQERVDEVNSGQNYIPDVLDLDLVDVVNSNYLSATQDYAVVSRADVVTICVPTPLDESKNPNTEFIERVVDNTLPHAHENQLFVLESTTYPGTTEEVIKPKLEEAGFAVGEDIYLAFSPERVDPGNTKYKTGNTPKVVGGVTGNCSRVARELYSRVIKGDIHVVDSPRVAEMEKLMENIFRIVNISLVNELAMLADKMDIDIWEVINAAKTKPFGYMAFYPGPGLGGHCIPLDPFYLSWKAKQHDFATRFIELAGQINDQMPDYVVRETMELLNEKGNALKGARIVVLGVAYKKDVDDIRESPAVNVMNLLQEKGANLSYHDPYIDSVVVDGKEYRSQRLTRGLLSSADLVLITTAHSEVDYRKVVRESGLIYDTRNALENFSADYIHKLGS